MNVREIQVKQISYITYTLTEAEVQALQFMLTVKIYDEHAPYSSTPYYEGNKVEAIKFIRTSKSIGLKEAKDLVEEYWNQIRNL